MIYDAQYVNKESVRINDANASHVENSMRNWWHGSPEKSTSRVTNSNSISSENPLLYRPEQAKLKTTVCHCKWVIVSFKMHFIHLYFSKPTFYIMLTDQQSTIQDEVIVNQKLIFKYSEPLYINAYQKYIERGIFHFCIKVNRPVPK